MTSNDTQTDYWQKQLANAVPLTGLPVDRERPPICSFLRGNASLRIDSQARLAIDALAAGEQTSVFAVLLAAFQAVLFRYTGQTDLVTCAVHTNAGKGPFFLRTRLSDDTKTTDLVRQVAVELTEAFAHSGCSFDALLGMLDGDSEFRGKSADNTAFLYTDAGAPESRAGSSPDGCFPNYLAQCDIVVSAHNGPAGLAIECDYDAELFEPPTIERLLNHFHTLLLGIVSKPELPVAVLPLMGPAELQQLVLHWNNTAAEFPRALCIHEAFETAAVRIPDSIALICGNAQLTYAELNARANQLAAHLRGLGVGPETLVGIGIARSLEMVVGLLGVLKAGGAYLPLDPAYPRDRLAFMLADSKASVLLTDSHLRDAWGEHPAKVICLDTDWDSIAQSPVANIESGVKSENLAYVIYTSGSTGKPKGVMVAHRNVMNFFTGMDQAIGGELPGTWLSVTSISFDISVLEIFWTLTRNFKVVLYAGDSSHQLLSGPATHRAAKPMDFSLFYFSASQDEDPDRRYHLLTEGARFADQHGFSAVWTPERHFHKFGGLYPNPALTSAAIAMITSKVQIRSGSVVAPLHTPIRIAEEWAVVDNLSHGRVAISFASGWMPEDFVIRPESYASRKEGMFRDIEIVRKLWRGESVAFPGPLGQDVAVRILPRPVQPELPVWVTAAGNPETFRMAGQIRANILTHLLGQSVSEVAEKVAIYRQAWQAAGHPGQGHVTLMLHTFVSDDLDSVRDTVRQPLIDYLRTSADLIKNYSWAFSAFKGQAKPEAALNFAELPKPELDAILAHAFDRYFETSGLFGTPASCLQTIDKLAAIGIDEAACLIDFGVSSDLVLENLCHLDSLREAVRVRQASAKAHASVAELIRQHHVTHLQCTPSMARMLMLDDEARAALPVLRQLMIGGEAFPASLAAELRRVVKGDIINMYGPTETTIWSTTCRLNGTHTSVPIGRPIANTETYILDRNLQPVPVGIPGELMIGGAGVVRGYLNRPELTAERFFKNPFRSEPGARLYRTGDLARFLPDGNIEFIGRLDTQVKIRGYRIELGEIEALLNTHPTVGQAVVVAREDVPGEKQIVAYVVYRNGQVPTMVQLREYILEKLPEHMVPARVVSLSAFPLTPNNKIDRKALPSPQKLKTEPEPNYEAPSSPIEEALAELWCETLRVSRVGRNEDFFQLGGDSLSAVQVLFQIRKACNVGLPPETLFHSPTLAGLAERLETALVAQAEKSDLLLAPVAEVLDARAEPGAAANACPAKPEGQTVFEPPRTEMEKVLAEICASTLGVQKVGRQDNFFELGGNSLMALQLISRLENFFRVTVPLRTLFDMPTVGELAAHLESSEPRRQTPASAVGRPEKPAPGALDGPGTQTIPRRSEAGKYPLSSGQQRLWFLQELDGGCHYNDHFDLRVAGRLKVPALERSIQEILRRHETMRATFPEIDGQAVQQINPPGQFALPVIDLRGLSEESRMAHATEEARKPFDLAEGPLWRFVLLCLADEDHLLLVTAHHIAIDGWSRGVFLRELGALYEGFCAGAASPLPELEIQYADFAAWQNERLEGEVVAQQLRFWKQTLAGAPPLLELPCDHPRPPLQSFRGARHFLTVSKPLADALKALGRQEGATLFMTLLAGFGTLLSRYTGQEDILIGSPVANRNHPGIEGLIGYFLNTVVLRSSFSGDTTFRQALNRVREACLGAFVNHELPLEKLIDALQPGRSQSYSPLFQVLFVLQNVPWPQLKLPGLSIQPFEIDNGTSKFDLTLSLSENSEGLTGWFEYSTDLFDAERMERMAGHLQTLFEGVVLSPDLPVSRLTLLTAPEQHEVLRAWNQTAVDFSQSVCLDGLFDRQVKLTPDRIALQFEKQQVTYAELDRRASRVASRLRSLGVGPESLVGLCLERSIDMVVGLLGILQSGGAYVPLDPDYPKERLEFILADSEVKVLLTETRLRESMSSLVWSGETIRPHLVCVDEISKTVAGQDSAGSAGGAVRPENLAYVIYTSGSTGKPKGVAVEHRAVVNFLESMRRCPGISPEDVLLAVTTLSFDIAGLELLLPLTTGSRVVIATRNVASDGHQLARLLDESGATIMQATPSTWRLLVEAGWTGDSRLKILCGGEAWDRELAELLLQRGGSVWNMYGPTETTIWSAACQVSRDAPIRIGSPIANTQFYVLDNALQPMPIGVPGQLYIGGEGLSRGYLNRPELTDSKFIPDPFSVEPGGRLYATGDLVRSFPGGNFEFLGRIDHQVKIRGFRIELGEIEAVLAAHPGVRESVVMARQDGADMKQLVAYVTPVAQSTLVVADLRRHLQQSLPDYMVPSAFVMLARLPRTPSGKIDRKTLPSPEPRRTDATVAMVAPRDVLELQLTKIWEKVLRVHPVGVRDNFFDLGGHSFVAVRLFASIQKITGKRLPLATLFQAPTVEQLAALMRNSGWTPHWSSLTAIQAAGNHPPFFCVHGGGGNVLLFAALAHHLGPEQPFYGLQCRGLDGEGAFLTTIEDMASHYLHELRQLQPEGPYYLGGFCMGGKVALEMAHRLHEDGEDVALLAFFDTYNHNGRQNNLSFRQKMVYAKEKVEFHWVNMKTLSSRDRWAYFSEKARGVKERQRVRIAAMWFRLRRMVSRGNRLRSGRPFLEDVNDQAGFAYMPRVYPGKVTLFRFQRNFSFITDPQLGWGDFVTGGMEVIDVTTNPGGMFVEPYVQLLASRLKTCLEESRRRHSA